MVKISNAMHVDAQPEEVLSGLLDSTLNPPGVTMAPVYDAPGREGSVTMELQDRRVPQKGIMIITGYVPGKRLSTRNFGALESTSTMTFEPENEGTRVTMNGESRLTFPLIGRFLDSFLERGMLKNTEWTMRQVEMRHAKKEATAT